MADSMKEWKPLGLSSGQGSLYLTLEGFGLTIFLFIIFYFKILSMYAQPQAQGRFPGQPYTHQPQYQGYPAQPISPPQYRQNFQGSMNPHGQPYLPPPDLQTGQRGSHAGVAYQNMGKNAALMQPPSLNVDEPDSNSQFFQQQQQRGPMTMSNNQHSQFDTYHQPEEEAMWTQEAQIASMFWEQRCMTMLERFQWFYDRFQILRNDHLILSEEMQKMDSEEEWHIFQQHHEEFHEKIEEMEQELSAVLGENEQLLQQRRTQDSQGVWEQRYQELLGNFKSLQEEMAHMESSGGRGGVPPEQYRQLEEHCAELQYQYEQAYNELKMHKDGGAISPDIEAQMHAYLEEIQSYKEKLNSLHSENVELQKMLEEYEAENQQLKQDRGRTTVDRSKFDDLARQVEAKEQEIRSLQEQFKRRSVSQTASAQLERLIQEKNYEIEELKRALNDKNNQISDINLLNSKLEQQEAATRSKAQQERKGLISDYQQKLSELRLELSKNDQSSKVEHLEKKLSYSNQEITNLNDTLKKKNQELIQLRSLTYEIEKLKEAQAELMRAADERDRFADALRKKTVEVTQLHQELEKLHAIISEQNSRRQQYSTRNLRLEIEDLTEQLNKNDGELNRLKSILALKEEYAGKLEEDLRQSRDRVAALQQILESEREGWHEKEVRLSSKSHDYSDRIRALDYQFNLQMKQTLEREVGSLRKLNAERQQTIRALEEKQLILQSQLSVYQKQQENHGRDLSLQKEKEKSLLASIEAQAKRFKDLELTLKRKDEEIALSQQRCKEALEESSSLRLQIDEHETLIKAKSKSIKELQEQLALSIAREGEQDKLALENARLQMTIETLQREKKTQEESPLAKSKGLSVNKSNKQLESRENMISELWNENEYLKAEIANLMKVSAQNNSYQSKQGKLVPLDLNRRLHEFNQRLQLTISNPGGQLSRSESQKTVILWEKERTQLIERYQTEINSLKQQLQGGRKLTGSQMSSQQLGNSKKLFIGGLQTQTLKEENTFLKQKSQELQQRNKHLISVNEDLRGKIDSMLKIKQNNATLNYYKEELQRAETEKDALKDKLRKATEELREHKLELAAKNTKLTQEHEFKVMQLQLLLQEQVRKISLLQGERTAASNNRATLEHDNNIKTLSKNQIIKNDEIVNTQSPKSNQYKLGIQQQFGSVLGNLSGYESPKGSVNVGASGVRGQGSRYQY